MTPLALRAAERGAVFHPDDGEATVELLHEAAQLRLAGAIAMCATLVSAAGDSPERLIAERTIHALAHLDPDQRFRFGSDPSVAAWLRLTSSSDQSLNSGGVAALAEMIPSALSEVTSINSLPDVALRRFDVHPLIAGIAPPTYDFSAALHRNPTQGEQIYSLDLFREFVDAAVIRIDQTWPELARVFPYSVRTIVHLPEADFRSASAARYSGLIMIGANDYSLLELEESLVHEFGHQLLYQVMELDAIILNDGDTEFALPWSGAERDFYGFYHAFYIYILLAKYYERVSRVRATEHDRAILRLSEIAVGLRAAVPEIRKAGQFTDFGWALTENLSKQAASLADRYGMTG